MSVNFCDEVIFSNTFKKKLWSSEDADISSLFLLFCSKQRTKQFIPVKGEERNKLVQMIRTTEASVYDVYKSQCMQFYINYNQINVCALIGQSAMVYCADKLMEKSRVF